MTLILSLASSSPSYHCKLDLPCPSLVPHHCSSPSPWFRYPASHLVEVPKSQRHRTSEWEGRALKIYLRIWRRLRKVWCRRRNGNKIIFGLKKIPFSTWHPSTFLLPPNLWSNFPFPKTRHQQKQGMLSSKSPDWLEREDTLAPLFPTTLLWTLQGSLLSIPDLCLCPGPHPQASWSPGPRSWNNKSQAIYFQTKF